MKNKIYHEQLRRLERANKELQKFSDITDDNFSQSIAAAEHFFFVAGHMRDWVKESGISQNLVDNFIQSNYELGVVRNLSLRLKHYDITRPSKAEIADFGLGIRIPIGRTWNEFEQKAKLFLPVDGKTLDILDLANKTITLWNDFLNKAELI